MVRKKRTNLPGPAESSEAQEVGTGRGSVEQRPPIQQPQQSLQPVQQPPPQGGRGSGPQRGGYGGRAGGGRTSPLQHYAAPADHQQGRDGQPYQRGGSPDPSESSGGRGHSTTGVPSRPSVPELHQARSL